MHDFSKSLGFATLALFAAAALLGRFLPALHLGAAWSGIALMGINAFAAIAILKLRTSIEPTRLILASMLIRLLFLAAIMLLVLRGISTEATVYSFVFAAMAGYVVYQAVEIRHILRNPGLLAK